MEYNIAQLGISDLDTVHMCPIFLNCHYSGLPIEIGLAAYFFPNAGLQRSNVFKTCKINF